MTYFYGFLLASFVGLLVVGLVIGRGVLGLSARRKKQSTALSIVYLLLAMLVVYLYMSGLMFDVVMK